MNVLVHIDQSWSYQLFEFNKNYLSTQDFLKFIDDLYRSAADYLKAHSNFQRDLDKATWSSLITGALRICDEHPKIGSQLQSALQALHSQLRPALGALPGRITNTTTVCDQQGILLGIVCHTE